MAPKPDLNMISSTEFIAKFLDSLAEVIEDGEYYRMHLIHACEHWAVKAAARKTNSGERRMARCIMTAMIDSDDWDGREDCPWYPEEAK